MHHHLVVELPSTHLIPSFPANGPSFPFLPRFGSCFPRFFLSSSKDGSNGSVLPLEESTGPSLSSSTSSGTTFLRDISSSFDVRSPLLFSLFSPFPLSSFSLLSLSLSLLSCPLLFHLLQATTTGATCEPTPSLDKVPTTIALSSSVSPSGP